MVDKFQLRYLAHQKRKRERIATQSEGIPFLVCHSASLFLDVLKHRRSRRIYSDKPIRKEDWLRILEAGLYAPSSCNRKAIEIKESKKGIHTLVGGKNWIEKADKVILFYANMKAYKSQNEVSFMPYLDTGFIAQNMYLMSEVLHVKTCFVNPNKTGSELNKRGRILTGAMAFGL